MRLAAAGIWTVLGGVFGVVWLTAMAGASLCLAIAAGTDGLILRCKKQIDGAW